MNKRPFFPLCCAALLLAGLTGCASSLDSSSSGTQAETAAYIRSDAVFYNPLTGFAPEADYPDAVGKHTLVYVDVLWSEWEPEEGVFDAEGIRESNRLDQWREQGKHVVLRFLCDKPGKEKHMDIPRWLYDKTGGNGAYYSYSGKQGYSPDYADPVLIEAHRKAIAALGEHFGQDTFVSYVELGSLGHWGEWHVNYEAGIPRLPAEAVREEYVTPYLSAFPNARLLMRRPFNTAEKYGFGLFDDMAGHPESTGEWLEWIEEGGDYNQTLEENALSPMPDAWKTAPIGGEFNSSLTMDWMLGSHLEETLSLLEKSHTTFLGPKVPNCRSEEDGAGHPEGIEAVLKTLGYRLRVTEAAYTPAREKERASLALTWTNDGNAPMYWDWPVYLYFLDSGNRIVGRCPVQLETTGLLPGTMITTRTDWTAEQMGDGVSAIGVGIEDPMTGKPAVSLTMETESVEKITILFRFTEKSGTA